MIVIHTQNELDSPANIIILYTIIIYNKKKMRHLKRIFVYFQKELSKNLKTHVIPYSTPTPNYNYYNNTLYNQCLQVEWYWWYVMPFIIIPITTLFVIINGTFPKYTFINNSWFQQNNLIWSSESRHYIQNMIQTLSFHIR